MNLSALIESYRTDKVSPYQKVRYRSQKHYDSLLRVIEQSDHREVGVLKNRDLLELHADWSARGISMAHSLMTMLRTLASYGSSVLEDDDCARLSARLRGMKFENGKPRVSRITREQVIAVRRQARLMGLGSVALAQAFQFDLMLRQGDVIGQWEPERLGAESDVRWRGEVWVRGLRFEEISAQILRHVTSKRGKAIEADLSLAGMVLEELDYVWPIYKRPERGPIVICERTGFPWQSHSFRSEWRKVARAAGIPDSVYSMDSRAGAISEATDLGIPTELVRHAATHSNATTTERYSRGAADKVREVQRIRANAAIGG